MKINQAKILKGILCFMELWEKANTKNDYIKIMLKNITKILKVTKFNYDNFIISFSAVKSPFSHKKGMFSLKVIFQGELI